MTRTASIQTRSVAPFSGCLRSLAVAALLVVVAWAAPHQAQAETLDDLFAQGNEAFFAGEFQAALESYDALVSAGVRDADVFFNQGTAYARDDQLGHAILAFERAAHLSPGDSQVEAALAQAREAIGRRMADAQGEATVRTRPPLRVALVRGFAESTLTWALLLFNGLFFGCLTARMLVSGDARRLSLAMAAAVGGLLTALTALALLVKVGAGEPGQPAVVVGRDASLREGPTDRAQPRQTAPEGGLGWVLEREAGWALVRLQGGGEGWLRDDQVGTVAATGPSDGS